MEGSLAGSCGCVNIALGCFLQEVCPGFLLMHISRITQVVRLIDRDSAGGRERENEGGVIEWTTRYPTLDIQNGGQLVRCCGCR